MATILHNVLKQLDLLMQAGKPVEEGDFNIQVGELRQGGAHLAAEHSEVERSGAKWRGRGRGRRNINWWIVLTEHGGTIGTRTQDLFHAMEAF